MADDQAARRIEHVVVLVLENRSFDHLMGSFPGAEGLKGGESNLLDPSKPESGDNPRFAVGTDAHWRITQGEGPLHSLNATNVQLAGTRDGPTVANPARDIGFVLSYRAALRADHVQDPSRGMLGLPMQSFTPDRLPALNTLAREFVLCDHWYCDVPGPTQPNRLFVHAATSAGYAHNVWDHVFGFRTIYNSLEEKGKTWAVYYSDDNEVAKFSQVVARAYTEPAEEARWQSDRANGASGAFFDYSTFFARHVASGDLPAYTYLIPAFGDSGEPEGDVNSMHPPHDVRPGDRLIAEVYEALRGNAEVWEKTLLVITWDEHGGFYDHEAPPSAPNPDGLTSPPEGDDSFAPKFGFDRLGLRVPAILVSPWLPRGRIDSTPYRHTSILATLKQLFGLGDFLTRRDASANSFAALIDERAAPRSDTPATLPRPPADPPGAGLVAPDVSEQKPDELLQGMLEGWYQIARTIPDGQGAPGELPTTHRDAHHFMREAVKRYANFRAETQPQYRVQGVAGGFRWELATADGRVLSASNQTFPTRDEAVRSIRDVKRFSIHAPIG